VEAAIKIVKEQANTKFLIVGEGPLKSQLTATLAAAGIAGNFVFLGTLKDDVLPAVYGCADLFVLPSIQEGQGIVLLEAQASGLPVVAFDVGGVNEAVCDGSTGLLVGRGNSGELADAALKLLVDESLRQRLGGAGRKFVSETFTWDICANKMFAVYEEVMKAVPR
jgi:glycosyltransferase involved in cell wall biosynthesis